jgi:arsenite-transporting ATPase
VCAVLSLIVTLPETTPVLEAAHLQDDLRRGGIEPWGWIVNASLAAAKTDHPLLKLRAEAERAQVAKVRDELAARFAVVPMQVEEPVGRDRLTALCQPAPSANIEETRRVAL